MNIKFLGTSYGAPSKERHQPSILIEENGSGYLFDAGAPVLDILVNGGYDLKRIKAIFITHMHGDHINGLFDVLNLANYFDMRFQIYLPDAKGVELVEQYCRLQNITFSDDRLTIRQILDGEFYCDEALTVRSVHTSHMEAVERSCFGFFVKSKSGTLYITGDLHKTLKDFPDFLYTTFADMIVTECAHFSPEDILEKISKCNVDRVAFIHVMPSAKYERLKELTKDIKIKFDFPCDGDEYKIEEE